MSDPTGKITNQTDLCIGCGVCSGICPAQQITMDWNQEGQWAPQGGKDCLSQCGLCRQTCPFGPDAVNETVIGERLFGGYPNIQYQPELGYFIGTYVGYVEHGGFRERGASGGLAGWFLNELLRQDLVDGVACVIGTSDAHRRFAFRVIRGTKELDGSAGSCYYPVEISEAIQEMLLQEGRYAVIGLPCLLKSLRQAMEFHPVLRRRIVLLAGLVCNHNKSSAFLGCLTRSVGLREDELTHARFRVSLPDRPSGDYGIALRNHRGETFVRRMAEIFPQAWAYPYFKLHACNYCDDLFAELADISFMDAWLPEYSREGGGTNLVITRSLFAEQFITEGILQQLVHLQPIPMERVIQSQKKALESKRIGLAHRLWLHKKEGHFVPPKRVEAKKPRCLQKAIIKASEELRQASHRGMIKQREEGEGGLRTYQRLMRRPIRHLRRLRQLERWERIGEKLLKKR